MWHSEHNSCITAIMHARHHTHTHKMNEKNSYFHICTMTVRIIIPPTARRGLCNKQHIHSSRQCCNESTSKSSTIHQYKNKIKELCAERNEKSREKHESNLKQRPHHRNKVTVTCELTLHYGTLYSGWVCVR